MYCHVGALRRKLRMLADVHRHGLLLGTHEDFGLIGSGLTSLRDAMSSCDNFEDHHGHELNAQAKSWSNRARELTCDVEDFADLFLHRIEVGGGGRTGTALVSRILSRLRRDRLPVPRVIAIELQELKARLSELLQQWWRLRGLDDLGLDPLEPVVDPRPTTRFVDVGCLVGLDGPMQDVTKMVTAAGEKLKIVSIVGMAGSGKTTLAAAVYQQLQEKKCFQLYAFLSMGKKPDAARKALQDMLSQLVGDGHPEEPFEYDDLYDYDLTQRLNEIFRDKSYLILVDDVWSPHNLGWIMDSFPDNSLGRLIITTRNHLLENFYCSSDCTYNISLLNEVDSKKLILDRAFGIGHGCPKHLEDVLAQITRRCSGLPLALVTVPSMLEDKSSKDEWDNLARSRWLSRPDAKVMKQILNLSYSDLLQYHKACLLDLSIFPEDFKVDVDRLIRRWIAGGDVHEMGDFSAVEMARTYIKDLMSRNMIQLLPPVHGASWYCRLHPVIHDFLVCKSMEDNFVTLVDDQKPHISNNCTTFHRRLSVQSSKHDQDLTSYDGMDISRVSSITVFGQASAAPHLTNLCVVRVLDLEGCVGPVCLEDLDKLPLLKYLSLKGTDVAYLPPELWELRFLESLDVRSTKVRQLPPSIVGLRHSLRTLLFSCEEMIDSIETTTMIAKHCRRLQNLATIDLREHHESFVKDLGDLSDLRMLEITWSFHQCTEGAYRKSLFSSMAKWSKLRSLTIHCGLGYSMEFLDSMSHPPQQLETFKVTAGVFLRVPEWIQRLHWLCVLQITICKIGRDDLSLLRKIPRLQCLILGLDLVPRNAIVIESDWFSELLRFSVNCPVPWLTFQEGSMPKLTHLQLELCSGLSCQENSVPSGIHYLQRLIEVVVYNEKWCGDSFSVRITVEAVKREVANAKHGNLIDLIINDDKVDVQKVEDEMKSITEIQSSDDDVGEEIARTTVETTQGEIEIEAECDITFAASTSS